VVAAGGDHDRVGIRNWLAVRRMTDPVQGVLRVADTYDAHPSSSGMRMRLTGVLTAPGVPPTPVDHLTDRGGRWVGNNELPVLVDRADPTRYVILWKLVQPWDPRAVATQQAQRMAQQLAQELAQPPADQPIPGFTSQSGQSTVTVTVSGGGPGAAEAARLLDAGTPARAVVTEVRDASVFGVSLADLTLEVTLADGARYPAHTRIGFSTPERRARIATTGAELPVRVDPRDRSRVTIDTRALGYT
jgi:hypothetical protein